MKLSGFVIFAVLAFAVGLGFIMQEKSAAQNSTQERTEVSAEKHDIAGIKAVPQAIKNAKAAGTVFEERNLFHPATKNADDEEDLRSALSGGVTFELDKTAAQQILQENIEFLNLRLPDGAGGTINLELEKVDIFAAGFSVKTSKPTGNEAAQQNFGVHYRGIIKGDDRSLAAISIFKNEVMGFYSAETSGNFVLGRLGGQNLTGKHILYAEKDLKASPDFSCDIPRERAGLPETVFEPQSASEIIARCIRLYLEADYDLFLNKGSVAEVNAYLTGMFNQSAALFANDGISFSLSEIYVWNSPSPFNSPFVLDALAQFKDVRTSYNGDLAHLITLDRQFGGAAFISSLCNRSLSYGVVDIDPMFENVPTYSWSVYALTHEAGHNLGSDHTHACVWNGNNTAIDACGPQAGFPYEGQCSNAPLPPPNGGTIMSYCHRNVGVNFSLGFGPQPRNLILNKYNSATCIADCGSNCSVTLTPAESPVFSSGFGTGAFNVQTGSDCLWETTINAPAQPLNIFSSYPSPLQQERQQPEKPFPPKGYAAPLHRQMPSDSQFAPAGIFASATPITILDRLSNSSTSAPRSASPYPTAIPVSGIVGMIRRIRVLINGLSHTSSDDIDILLAAPGRNIILMSDAGGNQSLNNVRLLFDQSAAELPNEAQIVSGTYRPSNFPGNPALDPQGQDTFPPNAPAQVSYSSNLDILNGLSPNGVWQLYIMDDEHPNAGSLANGWALEIMTDGAGGGNWIALTSASSGRGNSTISYLVNENLWNTPRAGTISIRGRTYMVRQGAPSTSPSRAPFDFDGDRKADLSVFRPSNGYWYINNSSNNSLTAIQFGANGDLIAPADFDGDGKTDICVFRPSDGGWYRLNSSNNTFSALQFGTSGDLPAPGDFDGDTKADITVYRPSAGSWYRINSSNNQFVAAQFGVAEDKPLVGDFDGDGKSDLAVFRPSNGTWYRINSAGNAFAANQFGIAEDKPVAADYDGDGKTDLAVYRPSVGDWYIINSSTGAWAAAHFGIAEDKPAPGDYDGDGKADLAVYRPSSGAWYLLRTTAGFTGAQFGSTGDAPAPSAFVR